VRLFFFSGGDNLVPDADCLLDAEESHHLCHVLRVRPGEAVTLTDGRGGLFEGRLLRRERGRARIRIEARREDPRETAPPRLRLVCAVVKGRRFEWALEKAVELGAHHIVPAATGRGVVKPRRGKQDRWQGLVQAAVKQALRSQLPALAPVTGFPDALDAALTSGPVYWAAAPGDAPDDALPGTDLLVETKATGAPAPPVPAWLTVCVGPEGGWTEDERRLLREGGARALDLGPHVLRTETAAVAALQVLQALRRRWSEGPEGSA
jgi:16S rRNA (uracil1498-N3)-methyltransferase